MVSRGYPGTLDEIERRVLGAMLAMQRLSWEQGVASHAMLDWGLDDLARAAAHDAVLRQNRAGKLAEIDDASVVNSASVAEVVRWAAMPSGEDSATDSDGLREAFDRQIDFLLHTADRAADGAFFHLEGSREVWIDTVYMVVPALVLAGRIDEARTQFRAHRDLLFDPTAQLYGARWSDDEKRVHHPEHWGTGTGWVLAAVARTIRLLDGHEPDFARELADHARPVIDACLALRRPDGAFHNVLDDAESFEEGTIAEMLAFTVASGVVDGWLPESYRSTALSLQHTVRSLADAGGVVRRVCGAPHFDRQGTSVEAQAFFLLAAAACRRLEVESPRSPTL